MSVALVNSTVTVTTAGTRVQTTATTSILVSSVYFEALGTNTNYIYIGLSNVSSTVYIARLDAGHGIAFTSDNSGGVRIGGVDIQLSQLWVDGSTNGNKVQMTYQQRV